MDPQWLSDSFDAFNEAVFSLINKMWWGLVLSLFFVGSLNYIPREVVMGVLGTKKGLKGIFRATLGGLLFDLCNHGILLVGMKLYERGATLGQTIAFLVASPWNSFSMTIILFTLIGFTKTILFIVLSCLIAVLSGFIFDILVEKKVLSQNPHASDVPPDLKAVNELKKILSKISFYPSSIFHVFYLGFKGSKMILRWVFFGIILVGLIRTFVSEGNFQTYFGPTLLGLSLTILVATILEVCSEGSAPIGADLVNVANAPGNGFAFLMTGVSTDYTEIIALKETTRSWKISFFLPLVTVPQIVFVGYLLNNFM